MVQISIKSNIKQFARQLTDVERKQLPFATSLGLNDTAFDVRSHIVKTTFPNAFDVRDAKFISVAMRVKKSTKRNLTASVFDRLERDFLMLQAEGGIKVPFGNHVAIPTTEVKQRRGARGVPKTLRPRQALQNKRTFIAKAKSGQRVIMRRRTKKRTPLQPLYVLERQARIPKRFPVVRDFERVVARRFGPNFAKAWRKALATARPRRR